MTADAWRSWGLMAIAQVALFLSALSAFITGFLVIAPRVTGELTICVDVAPPAPKIDGSLPGDRYITAERDARPEGVEFLFGRRAKVKLNAILFEASQRKVGN